MAISLRPSRRVTAAVYWAVVVVLVITLAVPAPGPWTVLLIMLLSLVLGLGPNAPQRVAVVFLLGGVGAVMLMMVGVRDWHGWYESVRTLVFSMLWVGFPWLIGFAWQLRGKVWQQAREAVEQQRRERAAQERRRRDAERISLAESLHDDLGHALSLVALNLGRLELDPELGEETRDTVTTARRQLSEAVERLGASVSLLRDSTVPGLVRRDDVAALIDEARDAGVEVTATGVLSPDRLTRYDRQTLVRVVQESLTNAVKHAPGQPISLMMDETAEGMAVSISNPLPASPHAVSGPGIGLEALTAQVESVDGTMRVRKDDNRFVVEVFLPAVASAGEPGKHVTEEADNESAILVRARRRGRVILASAVVVIVAALGMLETWTVYEAHRSLLSAENFARITPGERRSDIAELLPAHELSPSPESEPGVSCHDYAVTSQPLDDASGDVYRICFHDDTVHSTEYIPAENR